MGDWIAKGQAVEDVSIGDRGFQYGDGLFETIAVRNGAPRLFQYHIDRLTRGCRLLGIRMPSEGELSEGIVRAMKNSDATAAHAGVKVIVTAGPGLRGYGRDFADSPTVLYSAFHSAAPAKDSYRGGVDIVTCRTRLAIGSATAGLKTLNRLEQVLARSEFAGSDVFEGLTMDAEDNIICGTMSNVFFVNDNSISTPVLDQCGVEGVMRRHVVETLREQGTTVAIRPHPLSDLEDSDEVFLSNSQFGVIPVKRCVDVQWPVGEVTQQLMTILSGNAVPECRL
jgi:4-amino-4-deoxychorismate lyase